MMRSLHRVYASAAFYTAVNAIEALVPFVLTPVLTRILAPSAFGTWTIFVSLMALFRPIVTASFNEAIRMHFYSMRSAERANFIASALVMSALITTAFILAFTFGERYFVALFKMPGDWMVAVFIGSLFYGLFYCLLAFNQFSDDRKNFALLHVAQSAISIAAIVMLVCFGFGWEGAVVGKIIGLAACLALGIAFLTPGLSKIELARPSWHHIRQLGRFGIVYLPAGVGLVLAGITDRLIIAHYMDAASVGFYGAAELFGSVLALAVTGFLHGWMPWLFRRLEHSGSRVLPEIRYVSAAFFILLPIGSVLVYLASMIVAPILLGPTFHDAVELIPWAIAAMAARAVFSHNMAFLHFKGAIGLMSLSSLTFFVLNIVFTLWLVTDFGVPGVFAATCAAYIVATALNGGFVLSAYKRTQTTALVS